MRLFKILSSTLLVGLVALGLTVKENIKEKKYLETYDVLTEDTSKVKPNKVVRYQNTDTPEANNLISEVKAQVSSEVDNKRSIRFVAGIDSYLYNDAVFNIYVTEGDNVIKAYENKVTNRAYTAIVVNGEVKTATEVFGKQYNYLVAFTVDNVPSSAWNYVFEVTAGVRQNETDEYTYSSVATKGINTIVSAENYANNAVANLSYNWNVNAVYPTKKIFQKDTVVKLDVTSDIDWVVSYGAKSNDDAAVLQLGNIKIADYGYTSDLSLNESTITANTDVTSDEYKISAALNYAGDTTKIVSAIYSKDYIADITDVHFYWSAVEAGGYVRMLYQLEGEDTWKLLKRDDGENAVNASTGLAGCGTGERGAYNRYGYSNYLTNARELKGKNARIAFTYEIYNANSTVYYLSLGGIKVNTLNSAIDLVDKIGTNGLYEDMVAGSNGSYVRQLEVVLFGLSDEHKEKLNNLVISTFETAKESYWDYLKSLAAECGIAGYTE